MRSGWTTSRFDALVQEFTDSLTHEPDFRLPPQTGRVRCDYCGAYHPGEECRRCLDFLDEARAMVREKQRVAYRAQLRARHAIRRDAPGYEKQRLWKRSRRAARQWIKQVTTPANALHLGLACGLGALWSAVPEARPGIAWSGVAYAGAGAALIALRGHERLCRYQPYKCWHGLAVRGVPVSVPVHWAAFALLFGGTARGAVRAVADIATPEPHVARTPARHRLWTSVEDWGAWKMQHTASDLHGEVLSLHGTPRPHLTNTIGFARYNWLPRCLALSPDGKMLYVTGDGADVVVPIITRTNRVVRNEDLIRVGVQPRAISITPDGADAFVVNSGENSIAHIDLQSRRMMTTIAVGQPPTSIAFAPDGSFAYISTRGQWLLGGRGPMGGPGPGGEDGTVERFSLDDGRVTAIVNIGSPSREIAMSPQGDFAVLANTGGPSIERIRTRDNTLTANIPVTGMPWNVAISPDGSYALLSDRNSPRLWKLRLSDNRITHTFTLPGIASDIKIMPEGSHAMVTVEQALLFLRTDTGAIETNIALQQSPRDIAVARDGSFAYVAHGYSVSRIDGGVPRYDHQGTAQITVDTSESRRGAHAAQSLHLRKQDNPHGGTLTYYVASGPGKSAPGLPPTEQAGDGSRWSAQGWQRVQWDGDRAALPPLRGRYLHCAVYMATRNQHRSPVIKSLTLDYN